MPDIIVTGPLLILAGILVVVCILGIVGDFREAVPRAEDEAAVIAAKRRIDKPHLFWRVW